MLKAQRHEGRFLVRLWHQRQSGPDHWQQRTLQTVLDSAIDAGEGHRQQATRGWEPLQLAAKKLWPVVLYKVAWHHTALEETDLQTKEKFQPG